jgi:lipocalin
MEQAQLKALVARATALGFDTAKLRYLGKQKP